MINLGEHADFVISAYGGVTIITLAIIVYVALQSRRAKARLAALEAQGIRRRSAGPAA